MLPVNICADRCVRKLMQKMELYEVEMPERRKVNVQVLRATKYDAI